MMTDSKERDELHAELLKIELKKDRSEWADALIAAGYSKCSPIGYVILDAETKALDWDGDLHPSEESAIASLTGPNHMWCKTLEEEDEDHTYWGKGYIIRPVVNATTESLCFTVAPQ